MELALLFPQKTAPDGRQRILRLLVVPGGSNGSDFFIRLIE